MNPYDPPRTIPAKFVIEVESQYWRVGDLFAVRNHGCLPQVCVETGQRSDHCVTIKQIWQPRWVHSLLLLGLFPYFLVSPFVCQKVSLKVYICPAVHRRFMRKCWTAIATSVLGGLCCAGAMIIGTRSDAPAVLICFLGIVFIVYGIGDFSRPPIQLDIVKVEKDVVFIQGLHKRVLECGPAQET